MFYVYFIKSTSEDRYYFGSTINLRARLEEHNLGKVFSTKKYRPWILIYYEAYLEEKFARMREKRLKHHGNTVRQLRERIGLFKNSAGFTLLELLVVISVIGILTGVGFASFVSYSKKQSIDQAAFDLKTGIDEAKFNAVSRVKPSGCGALNRYRFVACTNASGQNDNCADSSISYRVDAICSPGNIIVPYNTKKRADNIIISIADGDCGGNRILRFYPLKNGTDINSCKIVISATDSSLTKTICVDAGGNASVKEGTVLSCSNL